MLRKLLVLIAFMAVAGLVACESGTEPVNEEFGFGAEVRIWGAQNGSMSHNVTDLLTPGMFETKWSGSEDHRWFEPMGVPSHSHNIGTNISLGLDAGDTITLSFRLSPVNGETARPLNVTPGVWVYVEQVVKGGTDLVTSEFRTAVEVNGRYQVSIVLPTQGGRYLVTTVAGAKVECNSAGRKQYVLDDVKYGMKAYGFSLGGSALYVLECPMVLPQYNVSG